MHTLLRAFSITLIFTFSLMVSGQDLMINGNLESWPTATDPEGWDKVENIFQETSTVLNGSSSARHESQSGTTDFMQDVEGITGGSNYTITYWFLDNDIAARARIWSYWTSGGATLDDHADVLRPTTYSEDNPEWIKWQADLTAPAGADGFRFEVRVYKQDDATGGSVFYDDFSVVPAGVAPEPTYYPTDFAANASGLNIKVSWTDANDEQIPTGYLVLGSDENNIQAPVDGTFVEDDPDLSDGSGALNIEQGTELAEFKNLLGATQYFFKIFPYTNGGTAVDYKTDGNPPSADATTGNISVIEFVDFNEGWDDWTAISVTGPQIWERDNNFGLEETPCAQMSGYAGGAVANEDWLISPPMDFNGYDGEILQFYNARNYQGNDLEILISNDYSGTGDPNAATWEALTAELSTSGWDWTPSGEVDVSTIDGDQVYVGFKYTSTSSAAASWEVDDVLITGIEKVGIPQIYQDYQVNIYPNPMSDFLMVSGEHDVYEMEIMSITGQVAFSGRIHNGQQVNIHDLQTGIYFIRIRPLSAATWNTRKLIVN